MKKLLSILIVAAILCCFAACVDGETPQTTNPDTGQNPSATTTTTTTSVEQGNTTTAHDHSHTTQGSEGSGDSDITDETTSTEGVEGETDITTATTVQGQQVTTGQVITTTTKKGETTKKTETTTSTTKKTTTTTTTKKTSTTTKKVVTTTINSSTTIKHTFSTATYTRVDSNFHKVTGKCSVCGTSTTQKESHTWGAWKYDVQPTATTGGVKYRVCKGCGEEQVVPVPATSVNTANFEERVFELVNAERAKYGLSALKYYTSGQTGADTRAKELLVYFSHTRPDGSKWWTATGFDRSVCQSGAENIAAGCSSPEEVVAAFMASSSHRANILSTTYTHIVVGYYEGAWVQIFIKPW